MISANGRLTINNITIRPKMTLNEFINSDKNKIADKIKDFRGRIFFLIRKCSIWNIEMSVSLFFFENKLTELTMGPSTPSHTKDFSEALQQLRQILKDNLGEPPYEYEWGKISAVCDHITSECSILIKYL